MAVVIGKRKRRSEIATTRRDEKSQETDSRVHALLQKHFEATYKPLDIHPLVPLQEESSDEAERSEDENEDDWEGLSDSGAPGAIEVVEHGASEAADEDTVKQERRAFMSNKPPSAGDFKTIKKAKSSKDATKEDPMEATNLKNDVALQRLLQESSLLQQGQTGLGTMPSSVHPTTSSFNHIGKARRRALDLRMQSLGADGSLFDQKKRPLDHRFGMVEKKRAKEADRRREAKENGIILEKEVKKDKKKDSGRDYRAAQIGAPSVGRMKRGTLMLSGKDVRAIQGPRNSGKPARRRR